VTGKLRSVQLCHTLVNNLLDCTRLVWRRLHHNHSTKIMWLDTLRTVLLYQHY